MSDQRDILERLRSAANSNELRHEAADEIERLRERVAEMQHEAGMYHSLYDVATERLASAINLLKAAYHLIPDSLYQPETKPAIKSFLDSLTDENGKS